MNTVRLRRIGALALTVACFAFITSPVLAIPAALPQPQTRTTASVVPTTWSAGDPQSPATSPASKPPVKPPVPVPTVVHPLPTVVLPVPKPPVEPPEPKPPVEPPVELPVPLPPTKTPVPVPPVDPTAEPEPEETPVPEPPTQSEAPAHEVRPAVRPTETSADRIVTEFLVKFEAGSGAGVLAQVEAGVAAHVVGHIPQLGVQVVRVASRSPEVALQALQRLPGVVYVEPNYPVHVLALPADPDVPVQWHLDAISALAAWDLATGNGVVIAVIDTGVDPGEFDLKDKLVPGYDFVNEDAEPWDDQGHGTRIALIAAAAADNGYGGAGVAYDARVMPLKALNNTGSGTHAWISKAIVWAADNGANIINLSIGGPYQSQTLQDAVNYAWRRGVVLVAAAGNENSNVPVYPAAYDPVLAVSGTTPDHKRASFSNWGDHVTVAAPGVNILVTRGGRHQMGRGTSLAAPQVAGVAALVLSRNPGLSNGQVRDIIQSTTNDLGNPGWDPFFGFGQVDAYQAVLAARRGSGSPNPTDAVVDAVNHARQLRDLPALRADDGLMAAAQRRAESLASRCVANGTVNLAACVAQLGSARRPFEVVLVGISSPDALVDLLAASPAGQALLFGPYWQIGAGYVDTGHGPLSQVWVLRFAQSQIRPGLGPPTPIMGLDR